jgi:hypothetical protein
MKSHPRRVTLPPESQGPTKVYDVTTQKSDTVARTSRPYQSTRPRVPVQWHCRQNLKALPKYMTSQPSKVTLSPETQGPTKVHEVTTQKSDTATRNSRPYQSTWRNTPVKWHCRQNLRALLKCMTSHPIKVTLLPETYGSTEVHDVTPQQNDTATRTSELYQSTWRHIPVKWHCCQNPVALPKCMT